MRSSSFIASTLAVPARKIACESARMILFMMCASSALYSPTSMLLQPAQPHRRQEPKTTNRPLAVFLPLAASSTEPGGILPLSAFATLRAGLHAFRNPFNPQNNYTPVTFLQKRLQPSDPAGHENS